ncbi:hypothetical protein BCIN_10g04260 [Botrytis cinerea B05.10]|uniref:Uncharacterized protein n=2 Tax=Botryotinia fuckeliana TaxID=40559 RepID=A0A384JV21_BOTFB|nr:hypothetical protein BCIN_10g04260 [Botrytis cinerea B05.10]ATZ54423.1 hypothetical protein BCIN_10g04260 [Botrytis cinerea B05.10]EMR82279.1 hypothetical protein BcDW1_9082 [Botrytis cinerea BcDW1]
MGELDELVSTLLGTFTSGIRLLRARRKRQKSSSGKTDHDNCEETLLIKSFKQSRSDIREAYTRESIKSGPKFSDGDAKARSSLSTILSRLNTAFTSAVVLFSRGKVKPADQELFIKLSNKSRTEAINTLDNLSKRLSKSSSSLVSHDTVNPSKPHRRKRHRNPPPTLPTQPTALGPATKNGWIRSKPTKNDLPKSKTRTQKSTLTKSTHKEKPATSRPITLLEKQESPPKTAVENRKSGFSFASDSTKLGEIPESKMARLLAGAGAGAGVASHDNDSRYYPTVVAFPLAPYRAEPPKRRFGMGKLWKHRPAEKEFVYGGGSG